MFLIIAQFAQLLVVVLHCLLIGTAVVHRVTGGSRPGAGQVARRAGVLAEVRAVDQTNTYLVAFFGVSTGLALNIAALFLLGLAGLLTPLAVALAMLAMAGAAAYYLWRERRAGAWRAAEWWAGAAGPSASSAAAAAGSAGAAGARMRSRWGWLPHAMLLAALFVAIGAQAFKAPGIWDDTAYQLPYARFFLEQQGIALQPYLRFPLFPCNMNLLFTAGLMFGGAPLAQGIATLPLFVMALGLIGACLQVMRSMFAGVLAVALLLSLKPVTSVLGYAYVDNGLALFGWASVLALMRWLDSDRRDTGWLQLAALFAGTAAGIKLFGGVWAFLVGLYLVVFVRQWRAVLVFAAIAALFGGGWYLRSFLIAGDPVHPAGGDWFGHFLWNADDLASSRAEQATHGVARHPLMFWAALRAAGVELLLPAFAAFLCWRRSEASIRAGYLLFVGYFVFWFFVTQVERYLSPLLGIGSFLAVLCLYRLVLGPLARRLRLRWPRLRAVPVAGGALVVLSLALIAVGARTAIEHVDRWETRLASRAGYHSFHAASAQIARYGPRLVQIGFENAVYFFDGLVIGDWFGPGRYSQFLDCRPDCVLIAPAAMAERMAAFDARMLVVNPKRFPIDLHAYQQRFEAQHQPDGGILFTLEPAPGGTTHPR